MLYLRDYIHLLLPYLPERRNENVAAGRYRSRRSLLLFKVEASNPLVDA
jgi:hypothetical protein